jgi:2-keto-3-deoxy-L-rhamnonate aldolase RhmA
MQIESKVGCDNAEAIAAVEGVDCLMVGNGDLRMDLGLPPGLDGPEESYNKCLQQVVDAGRKYNRPVLTFTGGPGQVEKRLKQGFSAFMVGADAFAIGGSMRQTFQQSYDEIKGWQKAGEHVEGWQF